MPISLKDRLTQLLGEECFIPIDSDGCLLLAETHLLNPDDGSPADEPWVQQLLVTGFDRDEIAFSFDTKTHKSYSLYIKADGDSFIAKACDYIVLKKVDERWHVVVGELKMKRVDKKEVLQQTSGSLAFVRYLQALLELDDDEKFKHLKEEFKNIKVIRRVVSCLVPKVSKPKKQRKTVGGRSRKRTSIDTRPQHEPLDTAYPFNEIISSKLLFDAKDNSKKEMSMKDFLCLNES